MSGMDPRRRLVCSAFAAGGAITAMPSLAKLNFAKDGFSWDPIFEGMAQQQRLLLLDPSREIQILYRR